MSQYSYPVIEDDKIPAPKMINTLHDFERLFLHVISHFYDEINAYGSRTRLLISIRSILTGYIPAVYPQYLDDYPSSLLDIYALVGETIRINREMQKGPGSALLDPGPFLSFICHSFSGLIIATLSCLHRQQLKPPSLFHSVRLRR